MLNVFNSYAELAGGRHGPVAAGLSRAKGHPPLSTGPATAAPRGWDYRGIVSRPTEEGINHYRFTTTATGAMVCTIVWNKAFKATAVNQLDLYLYNSNGSLLAESISPVDNVQQLNLSGLNPGTYELEVVKLAGPLGAPGVVSAREVYAMAWDFDR